MKENNLVVNLLGSPNSGKSVLAASLYAGLKKEHVDCGLVTEVARQMVLERNTMALENQFFIWSKQFHHIYCSYNHHQVTVTDSPVLLGAIYNKEPSAAFVKVVIEKYNIYNNLNIFLELDHTRPYSMSGRLHSFTESIMIQNQILDFLDQHNIPFMMYSDSTDEDIIEIVKEVIQ